jgi:hypothetical protein
VLLLFICLGLLLLTGFVTVATETFTNLLTGSSLWTTLREFLLGSWLFALTACGWAGTVWIGLRLLGHPTSFFWVLEVLAFAHIPLLAYPVTIFPTLGYRLEQILRMSVYLTLALTLLWKCELAPHTAALLALPGWLAHFLSIEVRLYRRGEQA